MVITVETLFKITVNVFYMQSFTLFKNNILKTIDNNISPECREKTRIFHQNAGKKPALNVIDQYFNQVANFHSYSH